MNELYLMVTITDRNKTKRYMALYESCGINVTFGMAGYGTAAGEMLEYFGLEQSEKALNINFHYCPLLAAWRKLGLPEEDLPELCDIAMDGDRGIISTYADEGFSFELGKTLAKGDDVCQIRISKK